MFLWGTKDCSLHICVQLVLLISKKKKKTVLSGIALFKHLCQKLRNIKKTYIKKNTEMPYGNDINTMIILACKDVHEQSYRARSFPARIGDTIDHVRY